MNDYPIWWNTTVTIYNKYEDPQTNLVTWFKHTVEGCFWKDISDKVKVGQTVLATDNIVCRIPEQESFKERYEWISLPNDEMAEYFTLGVGDIIVKGAIDEDIDEYVTGHRSTDFIKKHKNLQGCMEIEKSAINVGVGRCNPHYYVKGI